MTMLLVIETCSERLRLLYARTVLLLELSILCRVVAESPFATCTLLLCTPRHESARGCSARFVQV